MIIASLVYPFQLSGGATLSFRAQGVSNSESVGHGEGTHIDDTHTLSPE